MSHQPTTQPSHTAGDAGSITVLLLGVTIIMVLGLGGLSLDLWRAFDTRRDLAGIVDAAALAGASGIDQAHYHAAGEVRLDPDLARQLAAASLARHLPALADAAVTIAPDQTAITVTASRHVPLTLLRPFVTGDPWVSATATSSPGRLTP